MKHYLEITSNPTLPGADGIYVWDYSIVNIAVLFSNIRVNSNSTNVTVQLHIPCLHIMPFRCLTELDSEL